MIETAKASAPSVVPIGRTCPRCGSASSHMKLMWHHWLFCVLGVLMPPLWLILFYAWRQCNDCGCIYHPKWIKPSSPSKDKPSQTVCWYCGERPAEAEAAIIHYLYKDNDSQSVVVPRCEVCQAIHSDDSTGRFSTVGAVGGAVLGIPGTIGLMIPLGIAGWWVGRIMGSRHDRRAAGYKAIAAGLSNTPADQYDYLERFPAIVELKKKGWKFSPPPGSGVSPDYCPVCNVYVGTSGFKGLGKMLSGDNRVSTARVCAICGKAGCGLCMHFHHGNDVYWKNDTLYIRGPIAGNADLVTTIHIKNASWRHNDCCRQDGCDFGKINGRGVPMG